MHDLKTKKKHSGTLDAENWSFSIFFFVFDTGWLNGWPLLAFTPCGDMHGLVRE
jgi:hypothetical protein